VLGIDRTPHGPESALLALDPDDDALLGAGIVHAVNDALGEAALG
jgi:hypothetical protein